MLESSFSINTSSLCYVADGLLLAITVSTGQVKAFVRREALQRLSKKLEDAKSAGIGVHGDEIKIRESQQLPVRAQT